MLLDESFELHYPRIPDPISRSTLLEMIGATKSWRFRMSFAVLIAGGTSGS